MPKESVKRKTSNIWSFFTVLNTKHPTVALPPMNKDSINSVCNQNKDTDLSICLEEIIDKPDQSRSMDSSLYAAASFAAASPAAASPAAASSAASSFAASSTAVSSSSSTAVSSSSSSAVSFVLESVKDKIGINNILPKSVSQCENISLLLPKKLTNKEKKKIDDKLLHLFVKDFQPFRIVEDKGFIEFVRALNPTYQIPSRHFISKTAIPSLYEECLTNSKELINCGSSFCLTTDCWTSRNTDSYIALTAHFINDDFELVSILLECSAICTNHSSQNLAYELKRIVHDWGIEKKIMLVVSDNASNIKNAISKELGWKHFGCFAHTLNLIVSDALHIDAVTEILEKVKIIVGHFKRSYILHEKLMSFQKNNGNEPLKLIQECPTRWNSTYFMLERFSKLETAIRSTLAILDKDLPILTVEEWKIINELCQVLKPFEAITKTISGEKYCSASLVIPLVNGLKNICTILPKKDFSKLTMEVISELQNGVNVRLSNIESSTTLSLCTFLDPRFKGLAFSNTNAAEHARKFVISALISHIDNINQTKYNITNENAKPLNQNESGKDELSVWYMFDNIAVTKNKPTKTPMSKALIEVQRYSDEVEIISRDKNPNIWWKENAQYFPYLSSLAKKYLCALGTSVPCERLFSKAGLILSDRRNRLTKDKVKKLLFLNINIK